MNSNISMLSHGFSKNEYQSRLEKAHKRISNFRLDALMLTTPHNFRYFSGFDSYFWESPTRPWFLIIPNNQEPIAIIPSIGESAFKKTWIKNIYTWQSPNPEDEGISMLVNIINKIKNKYGNIGVEIGNESTIRMPLRDYINLQNRIKGIFNVRNSK